MNNDSVTEIHPPAGETPPPRAGGALGARRAFALTEAERQALVQQLCAPDLRRARRIRIQALLLSADGLSTGQIARRLCVGQSSVTQWRREFRSGGLSAFIGN